MAVLVKINRHRKGSVISMCDDNLLGKIYKDKKYCLDLIKYRSFYEGIDSEKIKNIKEEFHNALSINAIGRESLEMLKKNGFDVSNAKKIGKKVWHVQIYRL